MAKRISDEDLAYWSRDLSAMDGEHLSDLVDEVRRLRAAITAMTPVVEAAEKVFDCDGNGTKERVALSVLDDAVEAYRAAKTNELGHG